MKRKKIINVLIGLIVIVIILDIGLVLYNKKLDTRTKYICYGKTEKQNLINSGITYDLISSYEFYVTKDNRIESGAIITQFVFENANDYEIFIETADTTNPEERIKDYDKDNLKITYTFLNEFPNLNEKNQQLFTNDYFEQIKELGFDCQK